MKQSNIMRKRQVSVEAESATPSWGDPVKSLLHKLASCNVRPKEKSVAQELGSMHAEDNNLFQRSVKLHAKAWGSSLDYYRINPDNVSYLNKIFIFSQYR